MADKNDSSTGRKAARITNAITLRHAVLRQVPRRIVLRGAVTVPAVPALLEHYVGMFSGLFGALGRTSISAQVDQLRQLLDQSLWRGYRSSPHALVRVEYRTHPAARSMLGYEVNVISATIAQQYDNLFKQHGRALLSTEPDPFAEQLSARLSPGARILDLGAGLGRHTFPWLERGFAVDAVDISPALAAELKLLADERGLTPRILAGDGISRLLPLPRRYYDLVFLADVVTAHVRSPGHLARLFERACELLQPGGYFAFNAFVADENVKLEDVFRQVSEAFWCVLFSRQELSSITQSLPLEKVLEHMAEERRSAPALLDWLPFAQLAEWAELRHMFDLSAEQIPARLYWQLFQRRAQY